MDAYACGMVNWMVGLPLFVLSVWAGFWAWFYERRIRGWQQMAAGKLAPGPWVVVRGRVETIGGGPAISVEIDQEERTHEDTESSYTKWHEIARRVSTRPFDLVTGTGLRVRVEPAVGRIDYCDALDGKVALGPNRRTRTATLDPGEEVHVAGHLTGGLDGGGGPYRDGGLILRPPAGGRMLVSTEALGGVAVRRRRRHLIALALILAELLLGYGVHVFALAGADCGEGGFIGMQFAVVLVTPFVYAFFASKGEWYEQPKIDELS